MVGIVGSVVESGIEVSVELGLGSSVESGMEASVEQGLGGSVVESGSMPL